MGKTTRVRLDADRSRHVRTRPLPEGTVSLPLAVLATLAATIAKGEGKTGSAIARIHLRPDAVVMWRGPRKGGIMLAADSEGNTIPQGDAETWIDQRPPTQGGDMAHDWSVVASVLSCARCKRSSRVTLAVSDRGYLTIADDADSPRWSVTLYNMPAGGNQAIAAIWSPWSVQASEGIAA